MKRIFLSFFLLAAGCGFAVSSSPADSELPGKNEALKLDVFAARGFLGGSEYERYHLEDRVLWKECGSVSPAGRAKEQKKLEGDEVLSKDPQLSIQERRVEKLDGDQMNAIRSKAWELLSERAQQGLHDEPPPGSVFALSAPGVFEMYAEFAAKKDRIISSVDAVADKSTSSLEKAHELFALLRGVGPEICGVRTFYGIERK